MAIENHIYADIALLIITSEQNINFENILDRNLFQKTFELFKNQNPDLYDRWNNNKVHSIHLTGIDIFISLLFWYRYEIRHLSQSDFQKTTPNSVKQLVQNIINLNSQKITDIGQKKLLDVARRLIYCIFNTTPSSASSKDFFEMIFQYLRSNDCIPEEKNLILKKIQYLLLKEYFLISLSTK